MKSAAEAFDHIQPFLTAQFDFRESGIDSVCNQLNIADGLSMGESLMKSGLKIGLAAAAGAVGAATGGMGWIALGAIGLGFAAGSEIVDAVFSAPGAPAGVEKYRLGRLNVLHEMKARETSGAAWVAAAFAWRDLGDPARVKEALAYASTAGIPESVLGILLKA
jgi:hypothetical protein